MINELLKIHNQCRPLPLEILDKSKYKNYIDILKDILPLDFKPELLEFQFAHFILEIFDYSENENEVQ